MDAVEHITRIARILRQPRGNAMLVGVGGSGKSSLTRFATFMGGFKLFSIELTRGYGSNEFREDLKKLYRTAGIAGEPVVFLFSDTQVRTGRSIDGPLRSTLRDTPGAHEHSLFGLLLHRRGPSRQRHDTSLAVSHWCASLAHALSVSQIVSESFLEDINNMLNSGEVPGMFAQDEKDRVCTDIREWVIAQGINPTKARVRVRLASTERASARVLTSSTHQQPRSSGTSLLILPAHRGRHRAGRVLLVLHRSRARQPAHRAGHEPGRRGVPRALPPVPLAHQLLHHRLVQPGARRFVFLHRPSPALAPATHRYRNPCHACVARSSEPSFMAPALAMQWPEDALLSVSRKFLANTNLGSDEVRRRLRACLRALTPPHAACSSPPGAAGCARSGAGQGRSEP